MKQVRWVFVYAKGTSARNLKKGTLSVKKIQNLVMGEG
jgi:hypothetical protein